MPNDYPDKHHSRRSDAVILKSIKQKFRETHGRDPNHLDTDHMTAELEKHKIFYHESNAISVRLFLEAAAKKGISFLFRKKPPPRDHSGG